MSVTSLLEPSLPPPPSRTLTPVETSLQSERPSSRNVPPVGTSLQSEGRCAVASVCCGVGKRLGRCCCLPFCGWASTIVIVRRMWGRAGGVRLHRLLAVGDRHGRAGARAHRGQRGHEERSRQRRDDCFLVVGGPLLACGSSREKADLGCGSCNSS